MLILQYEEGSGLSKKEREYNRNVRQHGHHISHNHGSRVSYVVPQTSEDDNKMVLERQFVKKGAQINNRLTDKRHQGPVTDKDYKVKDKETVSVADDTFIEPLGENIAAPDCSELHRKLSQVYDKVLVVDSIAAAREVVRKLITKYKGFIHACDTEVCFLAYLKLIGIFFFF